MLFIFFFFFNDTATTEIYTLSLHDALPISRSSGANAKACRCSRSSWCCTTTSGASGDGAEPRDETWRGLHRRAPARDTRGIRRRDRGGRARHSRAGEMLRDRLVRPRPGPPALTAISRENLENY